MLSMADLTWGSKLAELGPQRFTGELRIQSDNAWYWIAMSNGKVVNAISPAPGDAATPDASTSKSACGSNVG